MTESTVGALVARMQQGDTEAFSPPVEKYQKRVSTHIRRGVKDPERAKDLSQETLIFFKYQKKVVYFAEK